MNGIEPFLRRNYLETTLKTHLSSKIPSTKFDKRTAGSLSGIRPIWNVYTHCTLVLLITAGGWRSNCEPNLIYVDQTNESKLKNKFTTVISGPRAVSCGTLSSSNLIQLSATVFLAKFWRWIGVNKQIHKTFIQMNKALYLRQSIQEWTKWILWKTAFKKIWSDMVCLMVHSWILCPWSQYFNPFPANVSAHFNTFWHFAGSPKYFKGLFEIFNCFNSIKIWNLFKVNQNSITDAVLASALLQNSENWTEFITATEYR